MASGYGAVRWWVDIHPENTYDPEGSSPIVLVNFGDRIAEEIAPPWSQQVQTTLLLRGNAMRQFGRGNLASEMSFTVYRNHADDKAARNWMMDHITSLPNRVSKKLKVEVNGIGGKKYLLSNAVIREVVSQMVLIAPTWRTVTRYSIAGGAWSVTA